MNLNSQTLAQIKVKLDLATMRAELNHIPHTPIKFYLNWRTQKYELVAALPYRDLTGDYRVWERITKGN